MARRLARTEGIPGGISSGRSAGGGRHGSPSGRRWRGKTIVTIIPSFAERYLSTALFEDA